MEWHGAQRMPAPDKTARLAVASRLVGVSSSTRRSRSWRCGLNPGIWFLPLATAFASEPGNAGQHALELRQRFAQVDAARAHGHLADRQLVFAAALLDHRKRAAHATGGFEIAEEDDVVGEIAGVDGRVHRIADH